MKLQWKVIFLAAAIISFSAQSSAFCIIGNSACPQTGVGWPTSGAPFHIQNFGAIPANQQATAPAFSAAFQQAITRWNGKSNFTYSAVNNAVDPCSIVHQGVGSTQGWGFATTVCGAVFGASTLAIARTFALSFTPSITTIVDSDIVFNSAKVFDVHAGNQNGPFASCIRFTGQPVDFTRVAVHESGHSLGLNHEPTNSAVMAPFYSECIESPQADDTNGLQALYGVSASTITLGLNGVAGFNTANTMTLTATTSVSNPPTFADVYVALQLPNGSLLVMQAGGSFSTALTPMLSNVSVPAFSGPIFNYTFTGTEPPGNYVWFAALTTPGTLNVIGTLATAPFTFAP